MKLLAVGTWYVVRGGLFAEPQALATVVQLLQADDGACYIRSEWACLPAVNGPATTSAQMGAILGRGAYETEAEAEEAAQAKMPHWHKPTNTTIRERCHKATEWDGALVGPARLADAIGVSLERLYAIARGEVLATTKQANAASAYGGRPV